MKNYTVIVGLCDQTTKTQLICTDAAEMILAEIVLKNAYGATFTRCKGIYKHDDGCIVIEESIKIELCGIDEESARAIAREAASSLNQESVFFKDDISGKISFVRYE